MKRIIKKKYVTIMMTGSLVGYSFMGAKKLLQDSDFTIGVVKDAIADKERTINSAKNIGFHYVLNKENMGEIEYIVHKVKNINIGILHIGKEQSERAIRQCIDDAKTRGAEFIVAYVAYDSEIDDMAVKIMADAGADYILGYGKKKVGPYSIIMTEDGKCVPVISGCGTFGGKQGRIMIMELQLMKDRLRSVQIVSEGYHPCLADGSITPIDDALKACNNHEERIELEDALFSIKTSMGINARCKCLVEGDKNLSVMMQGGYSPLQRQYEVQPVVTARKKQTLHSQRNKHYRYDDAKGIYIAEKQSAEREAKIICTGIIEYDRQIEEEAECFGHYEFRKRFKNIAELFKDADFVIGNLNGIASAEYPSISEVTKRAEESGYRNCRIEFLEALGEAGFTGIAAANSYNACLGIEGVIDTQNSIRNCGMIPSGIGYNKTPVVDINGIKIGFVSVTWECLGVENRLTGEATDKFLNIYHKNRTKAQIETAKSKGAEFVLAYINCGTDENMLGIEERRSTAEAVADMGADYVICTGAKDTSEQYCYVTENDRNVTIVTALGNFTGEREEICSDDNIVKVIVRRSFDGSIQVDDNKISGKRTTLKGKEFTKNFTIAEIYEFLGKTPSDTDLETFGDKYHQQITCFVAKEDAIQEGCVAILYDYINYGKTGEFEWDLQKCVDAGVSLIIDNKQHDELPCIVVDEPLIDVYRKMANKVIKQYDPIKVAITGSMGKTTTKEMTVEVFSNHFKTLTNSGNLNVIFNIGLMAQKLQEDDEAYIQEVHGGTIGMASDISKMIEPDICILTNIEKNHMSQVGTVENLITSKMGIIDGLKPGGVLIACKDNQYLRDIDPPVRTIKYSVSDPTCHYYGRNIRSEGDDLLFDIVVRESEFDHEGIYAARINMQGEHNVANAIAAFAAGRQAGIPPHEIIAGLSRYRTEGIRQNIIEHNGIKMIMDTHNSNPVALLSMLDVFDGFTPKKGGRKILILGMMGEQGEDSQQIHYDTGKAISKHEFDMMFCFGEDAKYMVQAVKECGKDAYYFNDRAVFNRMLADNIKSGDVVMVKGSHALKLDTATMVPIFGKNIRLY